MPRDASLTTTTHVGSAAATLSSGTDQQAVHVRESADDDLLTVHDAARFLKVSVSWVYEHVRLEAQDRLPAVKFGKYLRFDARDLRAWVDDKRVASMRTRRRR